jgi:hypothetical protein
MPARLGYPCDMNVPARLPHVLPRARLARLLAPTYAESMDVDEEEALDRLDRALGHPEVLAGIHGGVAEALEAARGPRTDEDAQLDRLSAGLQARASRVKAVPATPAVSAVMVWLNLAIGLAPESMRATLAGARGAGLLAAGLSEIGAGLVKDLVKR